MTSERWYSRRPERMQQYTQATWAYDVRHTWSGRMAPANENGIQVTFDETNCYFILLVFVFFFHVAVSLIYCWLCAMEYAPWARALPTFIRYYFIRTRTLARTRQLKYSVWFVVCVFFSSQTHTCVTRGVDVTVNLYWRKTSSVYGNDSLCHVFAGPETIFKKHIMKRCQRQRRTEDTSSLKLLSFAAFFHLPYFFSPTFESNKSIKKLPDITFSDV